MLNLINENPKARFGDLLHATFRPVWARGRLWKLLLVCAPVFSQASCHGEELQDLGTRGTTFAIEEEDLSLVLRRKAEEKGPCFVETLQEEAKERLRKGAREPKPVLWISEARELRSFYFDPSVTLHRDILDLEGKVVVVKGTVINPLHNNPWDGKLLLIDGDKDSHIEWAKKQPSPTKWVLVRGKPLDLEGSEGRPIYFDQFGAICKKLGVKAVPAVLSREGDRLLIEECPVDRRVL